MQPTFNRHLDTRPTNDAVLLNRLTRSQADRGDVVVLRSPEEGDLLIKRIAAIEGDSVRAADGTVCVVPPGQLWVEGDNPDNSRDSRRFGPVDRGLVVARVAAKVWPLPELGLVRRTPVPRHVECCAPSPDAALREGSRLARTLSHQAALHSL